MGYMDFLSLMNNSKLVLTDSGGIQEEATILGIPTLVTRITTERQEGLGITLKLVGTSPIDIVREGSEILKNNPPRCPSTVFGDGMASERIANIIYFHHSS